MIDNIVKGFRHRNTGMGDGIVRDNDTQGGISKDIGSQGGISKGIDTSGGIWRSGT